jgi:1-acyl-sn-glycerol-3-phosphate acyltransferase
MKRFIHFVVTGIINGLLHLLCKIDKTELSKIPAHSPCLLITNHVNFLEVPLLYTSLQPRILYSLLKEETWDNPFFSFLAGIWHAIPIKRGAADFTAFSAAEAVFQNNNMLIIAPEGTRSGTGILQRAHPGAVVLAVHNNVPIYPVAHTGGEKFYKQLKKCRRTDFTFHVGEPFYIHIDKDEKLDSSLRKILTAEMMSRLAVLLPEWQRGFYAASIKEPTPHLSFIGKLHD